MTSPQRLRALDLAWLEMEGEGPPIAIGTVAVADGPAPDPSDVVALLAQRMPRMAALNRGLGPEGTGVRRPPWVPAELDVAAHVHALAAEDGLGPAVGRIMARRLPRDRPLWDAWVVTGFDEAGGRDVEQGAGGDPAADPSGAAGAGPARDRRWALVWRVHHSIADGLGVLMLIGHGFDTEAGGGPTLAEAVLALRSGARPPGGAAAGDPPPRGADPTGAGAAHPDPAGSSAGSGPPGAPPESSRPGPDRPPALSLPALGLGRLARAVDAVRRVAPHVPSAVSSLVPQPPSALTGAVGEDRLWIPVEVSLADVRAIRRAFGVTVNDVVLAGVAGGFRRLLQGRGERVEGRVVRNMVPVSRRPAADGAAANEVSALLAHLPVGTDDPVRRLREVARAVEHARSAGEPALAALLLGLADRAVPLTVQDAAVSTLGRAVPAWFFDTLTTNVPGPPFPVFLAGRAVRAMYPIIPVAGHTAITTGIFSYAGSLDIGVTADAGVAPDLGVLAAGIVDSVAELLLLAPR